MWKKGIISILVGAACAYFAVENVNLGDLAGVLANTKVVYFLYAAVAFVISHIFRTFRWQLILLPTRKVPFNSVFGINAVGFMMITFLPFRLGEFGRPLLLSRRESVSYPAALASVAVERLFDGIAVIAILILGLTIAPLETETIPYIGWSTNFALGFGLAFFVPAFFVLFGMIIFKERSVAVVSFCTQMLSSKWRTKIVNITQHFVEGLRVLTSWKQIVAMLALSILVWFAFSVMTYLTFFSLDLQLPFYASFTVLGVLSLGVMLPGPPGFVGTYELFCKAALGLFAIDATTALGFAVASHTFNLLAVLLMGLVFLPFNPFTLREIREKAA